MKQHQYDILHEMRQNLIQLQQAVDRPGTLEVANLIFDRIRQAMVDLQVEASVYFSTLSEDSPIPLERRIESRVRMLANLMDVARREHKLEAR